MRKLLTLLGLLATINIEAASTLWFDISSAATIDSGVSTTSLASYRDSQGRDVNIVRIGAKETPDGTLAYLNFWYELDGAWYNDAEELIVEDYSARWTPVDLDSIAAVTDSGYTLVLEIGYVDLDAEPGEPGYDFQPLAYTTASLGQLVADKHTFPIGSIAPPDFSPWVPDRFYTYGYVPSPEPSSLALLLVGLAALLGKRAWG